MRNVDVAHKKNSFGWELPKWEEESSLEAYESLRDFIYLEDLKLSEEMGKLSNKPLKHLTLHDFNLSVIFIFIFYQQ